jgi:hypothetical protein
VAVWQFQVALIPKRWINAGGSVAALSTEEGWETACAWQGVRCDDLRSRIEGILPRGHSWSPSLTVWGSTECSDIQLFEQGGCIDSLNVRFDLRKPDMELFKSIADFAQDCGLAVIDLARKRTVSGLNELVRAAAESDAAHFVLDPASFLDQLGTGARAT